MHLILLDIDGTLVESYGFDTECFMAAVQDVLDIAVSSDWGAYPHVTDAGILHQIIAEQGLLNDHERLEVLVKERFIHHVDTHLSERGVNPVPGAPEFIEQLVGRNDVAVALATGGWLESARMKLEAAGIDVAGVPIASSSDHYCRMDIMRVAQQRAGRGSWESRTYFGDGPWDLKASVAMGYNFVLVGDRVDHPKSIKDFTDVAGVLALAGLAAVV